MDQTTDLPAPAGYALDGLLGSGGSGTVHRARQLASAGRPVAIKRAHREGGPEGVDLLRTEAEVLMRLDHPHIVKVHELIEWDGAPAVVMALAPGGSIADLLATSGPPPLEQALAIAAPVADALASAHRNGVAHGDVKPSNILLTSDGEPLLADFLLAAGGTEGYRDPALAPDAAPTPAADVHALGVLCHELLAPASGGLTAPLAEALAAATDPDPSRRPSAEGLARLLRAERGDGGDHRVLPRPAGPGAGCAGPSTRTYGARPPRPAPPAPLPALPRWLAAAAAVIVLAGTGLVMGRSGEADPAPPAPTALVARVAPAPPPERPACADAPVARAGGGQRLAVDPTGRGCTVPLLWDEGVATVHVGGNETRRYALGGPGDRLLIGDWDCTGAESAALYRPTTGEVFLFDGWPTDGAEEPPVRSARARPGGTPAVTAGSTGCDTVEVG
jgi:eukaryotic-like serine/threonine-protein kinase